MAAAIQFGPKLIQSGEKNWESKFSQKLEDSLVPIYGRIPAIIDFCKAAAAARSAVAVGLSRDFNSDDTRTALFVYLGICDALKTRLTSDFVLDTVWSLSLRPLSRMNSTNFHIERICVLFNLALSSAPLKAASLIASLSEDASRVFNQEAAPVDFKVEILSFISAALAAQAQGVVAVKAFDEGKSLGLVTKLAAEAAAQMIDARDRIAPVTEVDGSWRQLCALHANHFTALANFAAAAATEAETRKVLKGFGVLVARLKIARDETAAVLKGKPNDSVAALAEKIKVLLTSIEKDNNLVYHESVPSTLPDLPRVVAAPMPTLAMADLLNEANAFRPNTEIFCPKEIRQAVERLRSCIVAATAAAECVLTPALWGRIEVLKQKGGIGKAESDLTRMITSGKLCTQIAEDVKSQLAYEAGEYDKLRVMTNVNMMPSPQASQPFLNDLDSLTMSLGTAVSYNDEMQNKLNSLAPVAPFLQYSRNELSTYILSMAETSSSDPPSRVPEVEAGIQQLLKMSDMRQVAAEEARLASLLKGISPSLSSPRATFLSFLAESVEDALRVITDLESGDKFFSSWIVRGNQLQEQVRKFLAQRAEEARRLRR